MQDTNSEKVIDETSSIKIERYITSEATSDELQLEKHPESRLRPKSFAEFPGQDRAKENLKVYVEATKTRGRSLDHVLLHGPPGLGKTSLARVIASELAVPFYQTSGPAIEKAGDLAGILAGLERNSVLFIDEIHRLSVVVEEVLYSAMEEYSIDIVVGQGPTARTVKMPINSFTLIGATTRLSLLSSPLISRFGIAERFDYYDLDSLTRIILRSASIENISISKEGAIELARRSRGTPRIANRLIRRVRDFADVKGQKVISPEMVDSALKCMEIDVKGLDPLDRKILLTIKERYDGGPVGIETLAYTIGEDKNTVEDVYEPFLVHQGFVTRGPRGREITPLGREHLNQVIEFC
jgi:holliday junction DNA helicase RuvB